MTNERTIDQPGDHATHEAHAAAESVADSREQQIRLRAWWIWRERGGGDGNDVDDWLQAEIGFAKLWSGHRNAKIEVSKRRGAGCRASFRTSLSALSVSRRRQC
jgi:hypothetical protein